MLYSRLVPVLVALLESFGDTTIDDMTEFQEDCAGQGALCAGVRLQGLRGQKRDATRKC